MGKRNADNDLHNETPNKMAKHDIELSPSIVNDFVLTKELVNGKILTDLYGKKWRVGKPIGKFTISVCLQFMCKQIKKCFMQGQGFFFVKSIHLYFIK